MDHVVSDADVVLCGVETLTNMAGRRHAYPTEDEKVRHDVQDMLRASRPEKLDEDDVEKDGHVAVHVEDSR